MPKPRNAKLESATARRKLGVRKKPYYIRLSPGIALGYRRNAGAGTWTVRVAEGGAEWIKKIALADDLEGRARRTSFRIGKRSTLLARSPGGSPAKPSTKAVR